MHCEKKILNLFLNHIGKDFMNTEPESLSNIANDWYTVEVRRKQKVLLLFSIKFSNSLVEFNWDFSCIHQVRQHPFQALQPPLIPSMIQVLQE